MRNSGDIAAEQQNLVNEKLAAQVGQISTPDQAKCPERPNPKESLLRRLDYAEDSLIRHLAALRELRRALNWAGSETFEVLEKILEVEPILTRY